MVQFNNLSIGELITNLYNMVDTAPLTKDSGSKIWDEHVFECFNNPVMCLFSVFVPFGTPCMQCLDADFLFHDEKPNEKYIAFLMSCLLCCCGAASNRQKLREKFDIKGNYVLDCLLWWICPCCAANQEWRQVMKHYRKDPNTSICQALSKKQLRHLGNSKNFV